MENGGETKTVGRATGGFLKVVKKIVHEDDNNVSVDIFRLKLYMPF